MNWLGDSKPNFPAEISGILYAQSYATGVKGTCFATLVFGAVLAEAVQFYCGPSPGCATQFTVAPPQHFLYFFPEPHGHGSFRPTLGAVHRGSLVWAPQGDVATELQVFRLIYNTHAPAADPAEDAVMGNRLTHGLGGDSH